MMKPIRRMVPALVMMAMLPLHAGAADLKWDGFLDLTFMAIDDNGSQGRFDINGELDLNAALGNKVTSRIDLDLFNSATGGDSGVFEQAFVAWESQKGIQFKGGVFNNPLSWEAEDAPGLYQVSHGQLYSLWDGTTALHGNNVLGVSVSAQTGLITLTGAILNDLLETPEENSFMGVVGIKPNAQTDLKVGFITQDAGLETIVDINATYTQGLFMVGGEVMLPSEGVDMGLGVTGTYKFSQQATGTLRFDNVSYDGNADDSRSITIAASYMLEKNLAVNAELRSNNNGPADGDQVQFELIATF